MLRLDRERLRASLLGTKGIGPETADAILLYAAAHPTFPVDSYTRRFVVRHQLSRPAARYDEVKRLFERALPRRADVLGECHALLVALGKAYCRPAPRCSDCPVRWDLGAEETAATGPRVASLRGRAGRGAPRSSDEASRG